MLVEMNALPVSLVLSFTLISCSCGDETDGTTNQPDATSDATQIDARAEASAPDARLPDAAKPDATRPDAQVGDASFDATPDAAITRVNVTVPSNANIYGAGHASPPDGPSGVGEVPPLVTLTDGQTTLFLENVTGAVQYGPGIDPNGADGIEVTARSTPPVDGLSAVTVTRGRALLAVFLDDTEPMDPPPALFDSSDSAFTTLAPSLRQVFFVGDGLTEEGAGDRQTISIPAGATRVAFGLYDAISAGDTPGAFGDNTGSLSITVASY